MIQFDLNQASNLEASFFMAGIDEVGRGPLAGPVVASCVYWQGDQSLFEQDLKYLLKIGVNDSKKLSAKKRQGIISQVGLSWSLGQKSFFENNNLQRFSFSLVELDACEIDKINILQASLSAMEQSFRCCHFEKSLDHGRVLIDGNKKPKSFEAEKRVETIIKGDQKSLLIALASIIAKEYRDDLMVSLGKKFPGYGLERHAGYPTREHKKAIEELGVLPIHRRSFKGVKEFLNI